MIFNRIENFYWYHIKNLKKHERKLLKYQGYGSKSIIQFKERSGLSWKTMSKLLSVIKILDGLELRNYIRKFYEENESLFNNPNTYVTHFGPIGKSGALIVNQFLRCFPGKQYMVIPNSKISTLPDNANLIFLDDFIGTGKQGLDYVKNISYTLNASIKPYLFTICATNDGIKHIEKYGSNFKIKSQVLLSKEKYHLLDKDNNVLLESEKKEIIELNKKIGLDEKSKYHLGLPFAFYYSTPDNSLGILWSDKNEYLNNKNEEKKWYGLIPREY